MEKHFTSQNNEPNSDFRVTGKNPLFLHRAIWSEHLCNFRAHPDSALGKHLWNYSLVSESNCWYHGQFGEIMRNTLLTRVVKVTKSTTESVREQRWLHFINQRDMPWSPTCTSLRVFFGQVPVQGFAFTAGRTFNVLETLTISLTAERS